MTQEQFFKRIEECYKENVEISRRKNADYASNDNPFKNFELCEKLGICSTEKGILVRMSDKLQRICNLIETENKVLDEKIDDTLADLSNYSTILRLWMEQKKK